MVCVCVPVLCACVSGVYSRNCIDFIVMGKANNIFSSNNKGYMYYNYIYVTLKRGNFAPLGLERESQGKCLCLLILIAFISK